MASPTLFPSLSKQGIERRRFFFVLPLWDNFPVTTAEYWSISNSTPENLYFVSLTLTSLSLPPITLPIIFPVVFITAPVTVPTAFIVPPTTLPVALTSPQAIIDNLGEICSYINNEKVKLT